jgi:hypothetical protein
MENDDSIVCNHCRWNLFTKSPCLIMMESFQELYVCMYVCVRGGPNQPLHRDPQWSIVLPLL